MSVLHDRGLTDNIIFDELDLTEHQAGMLAFTLVYSTVQPLLVPAVDYNAMITCMDSIADYQVLGMTCTLLAASNLGMVAAAVAQCLLNVLQSLGMAGQAAPRAV